MREKNLCKSSNTKTLTVFYCIILILVVALFFTTIVLSIASIWGYMPRVLAFMLGLILLVNYFEKEKMIKESFKASEAKYLYAATIIAGIFCISVLGFSAGRLFVSHLGL